MVAAWCVGTIVGGIAQRTIEEHLAEYRVAHPIPSESDDVSDDAEAANAEPAEGQPSNLERTLDGSEAVARAGG